MLPVGKRLEAEDGTRRKIDLGLVMQGELTLLCGLAE